MVVIGPKIEGIICSIAFLSKQTDQLLSVRVYIFERTALRNCQFDLNKIAQLFRKGVGYIIPCYIIKKWSSNYNSLPIYKTIYTHDENRTLLKRAELEMPRSTKYHDAQCNRIVGFLCTYHSYALRTDFCERVWLI